MERDLKQIRDDISSNYALGQPSWCQEFAADLKLAVQHGFDARGEIDKEEISRLTHAAERHRDNAAERLQEIEKLKRMIKIQKKALRFLADTGHEAIDDKAIEALVEAEAILGEKE